MGNYTERNRRSRARQRYVFNQLKEGPCADCGQSFPPYVMEWDHVNGEKVESVAQLVSRGKFKKAKQEIAKCELVCANCHRIRTFARIGERAVLAPAMRVCRVCRRGPDEVQLVPRRHYCREHYNDSQREFMRERRARARA